MFADGADPMEMALLDDIFGAYARDMGVEMDGNTSATKRKASEEVKEKKKNQSSKAAKKVPVEDDGSLTREELSELNKQQNQRPARPRLPTAFTQTGVVEAAMDSGPMSPRTEDMMKSMPEHMKEIVDNREDVDLQKHHLEGASKDPTTFGPVNPHLPPVFTTGPKLRRPRVVGPPAQDGRRRSALLCALPVLFSSIRTKARGPRGLTTRRQRMRTERSRSEDHVAPCLDPLHLKTAKQFFGIDELLPFQRKIAEAALDGKDTCVYMATGSGKSLCFQLPAVVSGKVVIVVSPLISLMKEQVSKFNEIAEKRGLKLKACFLGSGHEDPKRRQDVDKAAVAGAAEVIQLSLSIARGFARHDCGGEYNLVYVTPEKLIQHSGLLHRFRPPMRLHFWRLMRLIASLNGAVSSGWVGELEPGRFPWKSSNRRPSYREIGFFREDYPDVPIMTLSAIKTPYVKDDIVEYLQLRDAEVVEGSAYRPNLLLKRSRPLPGRGDLPRIAEEISMDGERAIIYVHRRKEAEEVGAKLQELLADSNVSVSVYHAKIAQSVRNAAHSDFSAEGAHVMVATVAYGLGIDFPNVRRVYHLTAPALVERYYQQIGRAGRDGKPAICELIASDSDFATPAGSPAEMEVWARKSLESMRSLICSPKCLWNTLLKYFGEEPSFGKHCGNCDVCNAQEHRRDVTREAKVIFETVHMCQEHGWAQPLTWILSLVSNSKSAQKRFEGPQYRLLREHGAKAEEECRDMGLMKKKAICDFFKCLVPMLASAGYLRRQTISAGRWPKMRHYEVYHLAGKGHKVLEGESQVLLEIPPSLQDQLPEIAQ
eukprot:symbB.v1.2.003602.t1/scaffold202.1/size271277/13